MFASNDNKPPQAIKTRKTVSKKQPDPKDQLLFTLLYVTCITPSVQEVIAAFL
jgi:hypothetical protein